MGKIVDFFNASRGDGADNRKARFMALLRPHVPLLYRKALHWCGNPDDADDLLQAVLIKLADKTSDMEAVEKLAPWLVKVLYRQFVDSYRKQERSPVVSEADLTGAQDNPAQGMIDSFSDTGDFVQDLDDRNALIQALACLDHDMRHTFILMEYKGYSVEETARLLNEKPGTIKSRNHRAKQKLKKILSAGTISPSPAC